MSHCGAGRRSGTIRRTRLKEKRPPGLRRASKWRTFPYWMQKTRSRETTYDGATGQEEARGALPHHPGAPDHRRVLPDGAGLPPDDLHGRGVQRHDARYLHQARPAPGRQETDLRCAHGPGLRSRPHRTDPGVPGCGRFTGRGGQRLRRPLGGEGDLTGQRAGRAAAAPAVLGDDPALPGPDLDQGGGVCRTAGDFPGNLCRGSESRNCGVLLPPVHPAVRHVLLHPARQGVPGPHPLLHSARSRRREPPRRQVRVRCAGHDQGDTRDRSRPGWAGRPRVLGGGNPWMGILDRGDDDPVDHPRDRNGPGVGARRDLPVRAGPGG